jgi:hypothetical protein
MSDELTIVDINTPVLKDKKKHLGNIKLSNSKLTIKVHIFNPEMFLIIPLRNIDAQISKVYSYAGSIPEVVGEITHKEKTPFYQLKIKRTIYSIRANYIDLIKNESMLTLHIYEE